MYINQFVQRLLCFSPGALDPENLKNQRERVKIMDKLRVDGLVQLPDLLIRRRQYRQITIFTVRLYPVDLQYFITPGTVLFRIVESKFYKLSELVVLVFFSDVTESASHASVI